MKLDLRTLASGSGNITLPIGPKAVNAEILRLCGGGTLEITYDYRETSLTGTAIARVALLLECARCLREFSLPVEAEFSFTAKRGAPGGEEEDETLFFSDNEPRIDFGELVTQELAVNVPMKPVCGEACKGICAGCGADLNQEECICAVRDPHPGLGRA